MKIVLSKEEIKEAVGRWLDSKEIIIDWDTLNFVPEFTGGYEDTVTGFHIEVEMKK